MTGTPAMRPRRGAGQDARRQAGAPVVVTGAAGGIGQAVATRLVEDGWVVWSLDVTGPPEPIRRSGLVRGRLDVTDAAAVADLAVRLRAEGRPVAGLVNVAGILQDVESMLSQAPAQVERIWAVNYFGAHRCMRELAPLMVGGGSIVNVTSINAHRPLPLHAYAPAKVALDAATRLAAGELGNRGIRVNSVAPGFTLTPALAGRIAAGERNQDLVASAAALGRLVDPAEVAAVVSFLIGDGASAVTGVSIPVDAGWLVTSHWMDFGDRLAGEPDR